MDDANLGPTGERGGVDQIDGQPPAPPRRCGRGGRSRREDRCGSWPGRSRPAPAGPVAPAVTVGPEAGRAGTRTLRPPRPSTVASSPTISAIVPLTPSVRRHDRVSGAERAVRRTGSSSRESERAARLARRQAAPSLRSRSLSFSRAAGDAARPRWRSSRRASRIRPAAYSSSPRTSPSSASACASARCRSAGRRRAPPRSRREFLLGAFGCSVRGSCLPPLRVGGGERACVSRAAASASPTSSPSGAARVRSTRARPRRFREQAEPLGRLQRVRRPGRPSATCTGARSSRDRAPWPRWWLLRRRRPTPSAPRSGSSRPSAAPASPAGRGWPAPARRPRRDRCRPRARRGGRATVPSRRSRIATRLRTWAENVERLIAIDCSSPMSARISSKTGSAASSAGGRRPHWCSTAARPSVFSATVFPPVFGPLITSAGGAELQIDRNRRVRVEQRMPGSAQRRHCGFPSQGRRASRGRRSRGKARGRARPSPPPTS